MIKKTYLIFLMLTFVGCLDQKSKPVKDKKLIEYRKKGESYYKMKKCHVFLNGEKQATVNSFSGNVCFEKSGTTGFFACINGKFHLVKLWNKPCREVWNRKFKPGEKRNRWGGFAYKDFDWPKNYSPDCKDEWRCKRAKFGLEFIKD